MGASLRLSYPFDVVYKAMFHCGNYGVWHAESTQNDAENLDNHIIASDLLERIDSCAFSTEGRLDYSGSRSNRFSPEIWRMRAISNK